MPNSPQKRSTARLRVVACVTAAERHAIRYSDRGPASRLGSVLLRRSRTNLQRKLERTNEIVMRVQALSAIFLVTGSSFPSRRLQWIAGNLLAWPPQGSSEWALPPPLLLTR